MDNCILCQGPISPYWNRTNLWKCGACALIFRNPMPTAEELTDLYQASWETPGTNPSETGSTGAGLAKSYALKILETIGEDSFRNKKILEFGSGKGDVLTVLTQLGADAYGVEPFGYEFLKSRGVTVFRSVDEIPKDVLFDGIITIMVLEHLVKPWEDLSRLRLLLKNDGWIYIGTLNARGLNAQLLRSKWREVRKAGHLVFFTPANMSNVLKHSGFEAFKRVRWLIRFSRNPFRVVVHYLLQSLGLDGELRYFAWKRNDPLST